SLTTGTAATVTSISLTAGDWDVDGTVLFNLGATTTVTQLVGSISATDNTLDASVGRLTVNMFASGTVLGSAASPCVPCATTRVSLAATTTYY
ncbi:hypothetical protein ACMUML_13940, partial [Enterococcus faecalis]|uniref:hypothetical protein n=1 Tax=Enterococcus faecalis TaxID=1351 RepID=UPI003B7853EA